MPIFGDAYLADTTHLTTEEHGAYFLLLLAAWRQDDCALPNDDKKLARIAGVSPQKWKSIRSTIMDFWTADGDRIFQARQRRERKWVEQKNEGNRKNSVRGWKKRKGEASDDQDVENKQSDASDRNADAMRNGCETDAPPPPPLSKGIHQEDRSDSSDKSFNKETSHYAWAGKIIRLTPADFSTWQARYHGVSDLAAELGSLDDWISGQPEDVRKRWFHVVSGSLNKKHQAALKVTAPAGEEELLGPC